MMEAVKRGGDRQELHERIRQHSMAATARMKEDVYKRQTSESGDGLVWLTGYLPVDEAERFKAAAAKEHWAWAMDRCV